MNKKHSQYVDYSFPLHTMLFMYYVLRQLGPEQFPL